MSRDQSIPDLNSIMMRNTFKIEGIKAGRPIVGTCFLIGRPSEKQPKRAYFVLVTAAHVLDDMVGEEATIYLRKKDNNSFIKVPFSIRTRRGGSDLWAKNRSGLDVAAMYLTLPPIFDLQLLPTAMFADDGVLQKFEIHPGDEMYCLGFPFGFEANDAGFPVLRSGRIASFPLAPTQQYRTFLLDFEVFPGNSGGPVYFAESSRFIGNSLVAGRFQFIAGLVSQELSVTENIERLYGIEQQRYRLALAIVIHASHILETVNQLPNPETLDL